MESTSYTPPPTWSKATLFCPDCSHRSRYDGDWTVVDAGDERRYLCPDCRTEITVRPPFADGDGGCQR
ncbi:MAG: hypothetical protein ABEH78_02960 [Haloferacaceae archaeon]